MPLEHIDSIINLSLRAVFVTCKEVLPTMIAKRRGWIINISSDLGKFGLPNHAAYSASKFALNGFTESLALEVMEDGIRVNALGPAAVNTRMDRDTTEQAGKAFVPDIWQQPEDIAGAAVFLASDKANMVIGTALEVFGVFRPAWGFAAPKRFR